ncbi:PTS glucose transporter subunit IIA [bacterium]|nr:PTS glucose transporter subunit IIA [bacterium]
MEKKIILSPLDGVLLPLEDVPDPVFAQKIVGDGVAINPSSQTVFSPIDGIVSAVVKGGHALALKDKDGLEILIHIGIDTVKLKGEGFNCLVKEGQKVERGDKLIEFNIERIKMAGLPLISPIVLITHTYRLICPTPYGSELKALESPIFEIQPIF